MLACAALLAAGGCAARRPAAVPELATPAEQSGFARPSTSAEIVAFVDALAASSPRARASTLGWSAGGRPLRVLVVDPPGDASAPGDASPPGEGSAPGGDARRPFTVLLVGSQHGTEPSGSEAILAFARDLVTGRTPAPADLAGARFVLVPDGNPDGRDAHRRVNANGVNLSTNYVTLSEPEARAVAGALRRWQPDVLVDLHESALLKKKTLGAQGYLTDFEAQIETANNPNLDPELASLLASLLFEAIAAVRERGLPAQHYLGEITDVTQPITHGGPSVRNLRNATGMAGVAAFLVENRLDPPAEGYPTPRNLRARVEKQLTSLRAILAVAAAHRETIGQVTAAARAAWREDERPVTLAARWAEEPGAPRVSVPLRRRQDGVLETIDFPRHTRLEAREPVTVPFAYVVTEHREAIAAVLDRHGVAYERLATPTPARVTVRRIGAARRVPARHGWGYVEYEVRSRSEQVVLPAGALRVPLAQPARRLLPLLLEPRAPAGLFQEEPYASLVRPGEDFFVHRVERREDAPAPGVSRAPSRGRTAPRG